ncbi:MAG: 3-deoxy-7-phosphoheptulonate synthase [Patescibacteria group bacterium]|nr:3-deoxy-7-phosphoheptulonate synthase [Patescibacteria group bacterium]
MSPETALHHSTILEESIRVRDELLVVENVVEEAAHEARLNCLPGVRERLGYAPLDTDHAQDLIDTRIESKQTVIAPESLAEALPVTKEGAATTRIARAAIEAILHGDDDRLVVIVGPCSIHDPEAALEYASHVIAWRESYGNDLEIIMRAYMEKPRTELGWKGFVYDPLLDESDDINLGLVATRMLTSQIVNTGVPTGMERLNALTPQYVNGLVAYDAIGMRNTTDQKAREYGSGTSSPVGFKNTAEGERSVLSAAEAVVTARGPHAFLGVGMNNTTKQIETTGNDSAHIILRGDADGPNYEAEHINRAIKVLGQKGLLQAIIVDASHGNSRKKAANQQKVIADVARQVHDGQQAIKGVMIESFLLGGNQKLIPGKSRELKYGQSITDECVSIDETDVMLGMLAHALHKRRKAD